VAVVIARRAVVAFALALGASPLACGASSDSVTRLVDGRTVVGPFVPGDAYAAFLRGAIAEEQGRLGEALAAYDQVLAIDPTDPEPWARAADSGSDEVEGLWKEGRALGAAVMQISQSEDDEQISATTQILAEARKKIYGMLAQ